MDKITNSFWEGFTSIFELDPSHRPYEKEFGTDGELLAADWKTVIDYNPTNNTRQAS